MIKPCARKALLFLLLLESGLIPAQNFTSFKVTGTHAGDFAESNHCGASLAAGARCIIDIGFMPHGATARAAALTLVDTASSAPQAVALTGTGLPGPTLNLSVTSIAVTAATGTGGPLPPPPINFTANQADATTYFYKISYGGTAVGGVTAGGEVSVTSGATNPLIGKNPLGYAIGGTLSGSMGAANSILGRGFVPPGILAAGTYHDNVIVAVCHDAACTKPVGFSRRASKAWWRPAPVTARSAATR